MRAAEGREACRISDWMTTVIAICCLGIISAVSPAESDHSTLTVVVGSDTHANAESWQERIDVNTSAASVSIEQLRDFDGSYSLDLFNFSQKFHLTAAVVLGELDRAELPYLHLCFLSSFDDVDMLRPEALLLLRQKNPTTKKVAETDMGTESRTMEVLLTAEQAGRLLSSTISSRCADAADGVYVSDADYQKWSERAQESNGDDEWPMLKVRHLQSANLTRCKSQSSLTTNCLCELNTCVPWYPCGWKFCKTASDEPKNPAEPANEEVKCGIKTCRKCFAYLFEVSQKLLCMWDR